MKRSKRRVIEAIDLLKTIGDLWMPRLRYALKLECGHTVLRATNLTCGNNMLSPGGQGGHRLARCERCKCQK
jgi:hypothetical protein